MKKVLELDDGTYVLHYQLRFFLNDRQGIKDFTENNNVFLSFCEECRAYNLVSDMLCSDPNCAALVWDDDSDLPAFILPEGGEVEKALIDLGFEPLLIDEEDDGKDETPY